MESKKGMELPVNVVVMTIIGLIIFAMGLALFAQISEEAENTSEGLQDKIKSDISSLECDGRDWICAPSIKIKLGRSDTFEVFIANRGEVNKKFKIEVTGLDVDGYLGKSSSGCGKVWVDYPDFEDDVQSGFSASIPILVNTKQVSKECSFTTVVNLNESPSGDFVDKTPLIIRVEE